LHFKRVVGTRKVVWRWLYRYNESVIKRGEA
jgi:hypothetical protein